MLRRGNVYIWVTGYDSRGVLTTAGPYESEDDAAEATEHLGNTTFHRLNTRQHDKARRILRQKLMGSGARHGSRHASDEPEHEGHESSGTPMDRIRRMLDRRSKEEKEFDD